MASVWIPCHPKQTDRALRHGSQEEVKDKEGMLMSSYFQIQNLLWGTQGLTTWSCLTTRDRNLLSSRPMTRTQKRITSVLSRIRSLLTSTLRWLITRVVFRTMLISAIAAEEWIIWPQSSLDTSRLTTMATMMLTPTLAPAQLSLNPTSVQVDDLYQSMGQTMKLKKLQCKTWVHRALKGPKCKETII